MSEPLLSITGLEHRYGDRVALAGVDLAVAAGEAVALLGPNGAGKSTTVGALLGLVSPSAGEVRVCGTAPSRAVASGRVAAMLQDSGLPEDTRVGELVRLFATLYPDPLRPDEALELAGAADLERRGSKELSGGQTQRVRLALALVAAPDLLVLDEPTAAMDPQARRAFWATMKAQRGRERGLLFATHHLDEAEAIADRVVVLGAGRVIAEGTPEAVAASIGRGRLRARIPDGVAAELEALPGVDLVEGEEDGRFSLLCHDSDAAVRALLDRYPEASAVEVAGASLEDAFLALAAGEDRARATDPTAGSVR